MQVAFHDFDADGFSFHKDPVLVLDEFWTGEERKYFQQGMKKAAWKSLSDMAQVHAAFPSCGNWVKAEMGQTEASVFLERLYLPCIINYIESFPNIRRRHMNFNYYSYAVGDCLSTHDDTDDAYLAADTPGKVMPLRRLALATYFHDEWHPDWGGELIIYRPEKGSGSQPAQLEVTHCITPRPGSLVLFTVPRMHRVCRVDLLAGDHKRLSSAGWFMTEHEG